MTAPVGALAARIHDALVQFNWSNFGLDLVDEAETEWADALAEDLGRLVAEIFGQRPAADEGVVLVDHGPVKPPYGTPGREAYDREHGAS